MSSDIPDCQLEEFKNLISLSRGGEGVVQKGYHKRLGYVAVKTFNNRIDPSREIKLLAECPKHPNLIQLFGKIPDRYRTDEYIGYVMEYVEGSSLFNVIYNPMKKYTWSQIYRWIEQIGLGLQHLHAAGIIHRDVKPDNILLMATDNIKLTGFGIAKYAENRNAIFVGTYRYMAPEVITTTTYTFPADVYSFTITVWELTHRQKPYSDLKGVEIFDTLQEIQEGKKRPVLDLDKINQGLSDIIERGWHADVSIRLSLEEIIHFAHEESEKINKHEVADSAIDDVSIQQKFEGQPDQQKKPDTIVLFGNTRGVGACCVYILTSQKPKWRALSLELPGCPHYGGAVALNDEIYIFGGDTFREKLYKLNENLEWVQLASMNNGRTFILNSSLKWNGRIWVIGGYDIDEKKYLRSVECYDIDRNEWSLMPEMQTERHDAAAAVCNGKLYVYGGCKDFFGMLKTVECFDPESGVWTQLEDMPRALRAHSIIPSGNGFIILGGADGYRRPLNCVWKVTPNEKGNTEWEELKTMKTACMWPSTVMLNGDIYALGGICESKPSNSVLMKVEVFHGGQWRKGPALPIPLYGFSTVVISSQLAERLHSKMT